MSIKFFASELKVMNVLWNNGDTPAKTVAKLLGESVGWKANTTYTVIKKCIDKGGIERIEPGFVCHPLIEKEEVQKAETGELLENIFDGSADRLFAALLGAKKLSDEEISKLKALVNELKED